jgi:hypothetical protein
VVVIFDEIDALRGPSLVAGASAHVGAARRHPVRWARSAASLRKDWDGAPSPKLVGAERRRGLGFPIWSTPNVGEVRRSRFGRRRTSARFGADRGGRWGAEAGAAAPRRGPRGPRRGAGGLAAAHRRGLRRRGARRRGRGIRARGPSRDRARAGRRGPWRSGMGRSRTRR